MLQTPREDGRIRTDYTRHKTGTPARQQPGVLCPLGLLSPE